MYVCMYIKSPAITNIFYKQAVNPLGDRSDRAEPISIPPRNEISICRESVQTVRGPRYKLAGLRARRQGDVLTSISGFHSPCLLNSRETHAEGKICVTLPFSFFLPLVRGLKYAWQTLV